MKKNDGNRKVPLRPLGCFLVPVLILFMCIGAFSLAWGNSNFICFGTPFPSNADVENRAYFKFPQSANNIEYQTDGVNRKAGCTIWAKFDIQPNQLSEFLETTLVKHLDTSQLGDPFPYFVQEQRWNIGQQGLGGHIHTTLDTSVVYSDQWIWVDTSQPTMSTVYLVVNKEWL